MEVVTEAMGAAETTQRSCGKCRGRLLGTPEVQRDNRPPPTHTHMDWEGVASETEGKSEEGGARPSRASVSRRKEWTTVSNAAKRSSKISPEKCSLDLVTSWSLGTLARTASDGGEDQERKGER